MNPTPRVLILGANGRFGAATARAFAAAGWQVLAQVRRAPPEQMPGVQPLPVALADTAALVAAAAGARVVVYAVNPLYTRWDTEALPLLDQGLAVAQALNATFMLPGNVYNFGAQMPALLRADTPQQPTTPKGRMRHEMEEVVLRGRSTQGLRSVVIRAGDFFGAGTGSWFDQVVVKSLAQGKLVYPGPLDRAHAWAYLPDLAQAFVAVAGRTADLPAFATLHFAGHTVTGAELLAAVERAAGSLGLAPKRGWRHGSMPWGLIRAVGLVRPLWRELARMAYLWDVPHGLDGVALQALPGAPVPSTPLDAALRGALLALGLGAQPQGAASLAVRAG